MVARAQTGTRSGRVTASAPAPQRRRSRESRRATTRPSVLRRIGWIILVSPRHAALALATGLACGALASRIDGMVSPPYAAILGAAVFYPALLAVWRRIIWWRLHPRGGWRR